MKIGYARVSTKEQNLDLQIDALKKAGCDKIFTDKISGSLKDRPGLNEALRFARNGDSLIVWKLDRLGRSLRDLIDTVKNLQQVGVGFRSLNESIDTTSAGGKLIFHVFASLSEFERDLIRTRTKAGLEAAKIRGRSGGRPRALTSAKKNKVLSMIKNGSEIVDICKVVGVSRSTIYRLIASKSKFTL